MLKNTSYSGHEITSEVCKDIIKEAWYKQLLKFMSINLSCLYKVEKTNNTKKTTVGSDFTKE